MIFKHDKFECDIELNDTKTAAAIKKALPIKGSAEVWKEEVYFTIPLDLGQEKGVSKVEQGDVAYWPPGKCFCIFYGKTQPVSAVTVVGKSKCNPEKFRSVREGDEVVLRK